MAGCGNRSGLTVRSIERGDLVYQSIPTSAYFRRTAEGGFEVVMVHEPLDVPGQRGREGIEAVGEPPLRQIVHLRILWRPRRVPQQGERLAANASINWHLFGVGVEGEGDYLHYQGAGLVVIDTSDDAARVLIRRALIRPVEAGGRLADPLGPSQLTGSIMAQRNPRRVAAALELLRQREAAGWAGETSPVGWKQSATGEAGPDGSPFQLETQP